MDNCQLAGQNVVSNKQEGLLKNRLIVLQNFVCRYENSVFDIEKKIFVPLPTAANEQNCEELITANQYLDSVLARIDSANERLDYIYKCLTTQLRDDLKLE